MKRFIFCILTFVNLISYSQTIRFNKDYIVPQNSSLSDIYSVKQDDSSYLFIGVTQTIYPQSVISFATGLNGNITDTNEYGYSGSICLMSPESVFRNKLAFKILSSTKKIELYSMYGADTLNSHTVYEDTFDISVTGITGDSTAFYLTGWYGGDYWLIKTDTTGVIKWHKHYDGGSGQMDVSYHILKTSDNSLILGGESYGFGNGTETQWWILKLDTSGNIIWSKDYGNPNIRDYRPHGLIETADSNYIITGSYAVGMSGSSELLRGRILKIDQNGNIIWSKLYGNKTEETYIGITKQKQNNNLISILHDGISSIGYFVIIQELTPSGEILWFRKYKYSPDPYGYSVLNSFDFTSDGGYIFAGYGVDYDSVPAQRSWVIKTDSLGFDGVTDFSADTAYRIELSFDTCYNDTGLVITHTYGITAPYTITYAGFAIHDSLYYSPLYESYIADTLVITGSMLSGNDSIIGIPCTVTDGLGRVLHDTLTVNVGCLVSGINTLPAENGIRIYPNPANDNLTVEITNDKLRITNLEIIDLTGKQLLSKKYKVKSSKYRVDIGNLPAGIYFVKVETNEGTVIKKFVKQ